MSQADELLKGLTNEQIALYSGAGSGAEEPHIVICRDRKITIPEVLKRIAVEGDHDIETLTFDCPRMWDEHDLSKMILYINYRLPDGEVGSYIAENITPIDDDTFTFTWTISRTVSQKKGNIAFLVCAKKTEVTQQHVFVTSTSVLGYTPNGSPTGDITTTGEEVYYATEDRHFYCFVNGVAYFVSEQQVDGEPIETAHWNTELCTDAYISEGLEADPIVEEDYPDIVNQLLERMTVVENAEGNMEKLASDAKTYRDEAEGYMKDAMSFANELSFYHYEVQNSAAEIRNSYANAIEGKVSGEIVRVDDVSPLEHDVEVKVYGRNLIPFPYVGGESKVSNGITFTVLADGGVHINGTNTHSTYVEYPLVTTNSLEINASQVTMSLYGPETADIYCTVGSGGFEFGEVKSGTNTILDGNNTSQIFTYGLIRVKAGATVSDVTVYPMLNEGSTALPYEPYIDPDEVEVIRYGKNLVDSTQYITPRTVNGITVQYLPDEDAFLFNGTATAAARIGYSQLIGACEGEQFTCTIIPISGSVDKGTADYPPVIFFGKSDTRTGAGTNNISFQFTDTKTTLTQRVSGKYLKDSWFWISVGNILTNYKVRIQFERGDIATEYEQYQGRSTDTDGTKSVNPSMTIFTDTPGAIVDVTYNRDTTKVFDSYALTEEAKSEIAGLVKNEIDIPDVRVDQTYNPSSTNAQSGKAVAEAIGKIKIPEADNYEKYFEIIDEYYTNNRSKRVLVLKPQYRGATVDFSQDESISGVQLGNYTSQYITSNSTSDNGIGVAGSAIHLLPEKLYIPETINGESWTRLGKGCFAYNHMVKEIIPAIPLQEIPECVFAHAAKLEKIWNTEQVAGAGAAAFFGSGIKEIDLPNATLIYHKAFMNCGHLKRINVGKITKIEERTFLRCADLQEISHDSTCNITKVGNGAFYDTLSLKEADFLNTLTEIGDYAFVKCALNFDWRKLNGCTFGKYATPLQMNTSPGKAGGAIHDDPHTLTDDNYAIKHTPRHLNAPLRISQYHPKWVDEPINDFVTHYIGCAFYAVMNAYCGLNGLDYDDPRSLIDINKAIPITVEEKDSMPDISTMVKSEVYNNYYGNIVKYIGATDDNYTQNHYYRAYRENNNGTYQYYWHDIGTEQPTNIDLFMGNYGIRCFSDWLNGLGLTNSANIPITPNEYQNIIGALQNGSYVVLNVPMGWKNGTGHAIILHGVNANGEVLFIDSITLGRTILGDYNALSGSCLLQNLTYSVGISDTKEETMYQGSYMIISKKTTEAS